jgi:hypothetical protein
MQLLDLAARYAAVCAAAAGAWTPIYVKTTYFLLKPTGARRSTRTCSQPKTVAVVILVYSVPLVQQLQAAAAQHRLAGALLSN